MLENFSVAISVSPHVCFILVLILISMFLRKCIYELGIFHANQYFLLLAVPRRLFCFGSLVILDVARCYLWLFTLYINIKIGKKCC